MIYTVYERDCPIQTLIPDMREKDSYFDSVDEGHLLGDGSAIVYKTGGLQWGARK
jgi:hypothetical protein